MVIEVQFPGEAHDRIDEISDAITRVLVEHNETRIRFCASGGRPVLIPEKNDHDVYPGLSDLYKDWPLVTFATPIHLVHKLDAAAVFFASPIFKADQVLGLITELCEMDSPAGDRWLRAVLERETRRAVWFGRMETLPSGVRIKHALADVMAVLRVYEKMGVAPDSYTKVALPSGEEIEW